MRALIAALVIMTIGCAAQEPTATPTESQTHSQSTNTPDRSSSEKATVTIQPDARILLEFRRSISTRNAKPGDSVYLQTAFPVVINNKVSIPPGTFVQGTLDKVNHHGRNGVPELLLVRATMTFPDGYSVGIPGTIDIAPSKDYCRYERAEIAPAALAVGITAPLAGVAIGALVGRGGDHTTDINGVPQPTFNPPINVKGVMIGTSVGMAVGLTTLLASAGKNVFIEVGTPADMTLDQPLQLDE